MDFLADNEILLYIDKAYVGIYDLFKEKYQISINQLFIICACLGFKKNHFIKTMRSDKQFRSSYFKNKKSKDRTDFYTLVLNDPDFKNSIDKFDDSKFVKECVRKIEDYATGGMDILIKDVFQNFYKDGQLDPKYDEYDVDLLNYIYQDIQEVPF